MTVASFIASQRTEHRVPHAKCCRWLGVSESWFYKWHDREPTARQRRRVELVATVRPAIRPALRVEPARKHVGGDGIPFGTPPFDARGADAVRLRDEKRAIERDPRHRFRMHVMRRRSAAATSTGSCSTATRAASTTATCSPAPAETWA